MKITKKLDNLVKNKKTILGVGPMSLNCVDATIELSNKYNIPIILIASRRQIDSKDFGGGYVNNWDTKMFANYIKSKDKKKNIILARDHGGPWQNNIEIEKKYNLNDAMNSAKLSFARDIENDFKIIHVDTSIDINRNLEFKNSFERLCELYSFCINKSRKLKKNIIFEIGTEEQNGTTNTPIELKKTLNLFYNFCNKNKYQLPTFVVVQSGTKVMETKNVGSFESPLRVKNELPVEIQLPKMIEICNEHNIYMKEHNADYLSLDSLKWHPKIGIHAANVAPEFGVTETKSILKILNENNLKIFRERFLKLSYESYKWKKWMLPNTVASDYQKSIISGHYIFSTSSFLNLKDEINLTLKKKGINLNNYLKENVKMSIIKYLKAFNLVK